LIALTLAAAAVIAVLLIRWHQGSVSSLRERKTNQVDELSMSARQPSLPSTLGAFQVGSVEATVGLIAKLAAEESFRISSVSISHAGNIGADAAEVAIDIDGIAPYGALKSWLSLVLERAPALGVRRLSLSKGVAGTGLGVHVTFLLFAPV
jgi:hypothetical protein